MKFDITGRNIEITPAIKDFTRDKLSKLEKCIEGAFEAHVILFVEKHRHIAEVVVKGRNHTFTGTDETGDMYASIGNVVDKIEKQARRHKEKTSERRKRAKSPMRVAAPPEGGASMGKDGGEPAAQGPPRIIRNSNIRMKPMSMEDAALQFAGSDREFLVFRDERSQRITVMYRRKDGNLGVIEPDA